MTGECLYNNSASSSHSSISCEENEDMEGVCTDTISNFAHYMPIDLTVDILTRLQAKSLKRFQCVSNEWSSTIRSQGFIDSFTSASQARSRFLVAVRSAENHVFLLSSSHNETEKSTHPLATMRDSLGSLVKYVYATSLQTSLEMAMSGLLMDLVHCSSIHGFIGLSHPSDPGRFTVCNPSTRQVITLPDISKASNGRRKEGLYMYLGYDPVGNEYKALCSTAFNGARHQEHKVLTLGRGNLSWRDINGGRTLSYNVVTNGICINGMVYYIGVTTLSPEKKTRVFRFDVKGERLRFFTPPLSVIARGSLINFKGNLGVVYPVGKHPLHRFDILILDEGKGMWLHQSIVFHPLMLELAGEIKLKILGLTKLGEIIFGPLKLPHKHEPFYIFFCNNKLSDNRFIKRIRLKGLEEFGCNHTGDEQCVCQVFFSPEHFETLISL